MIRRGVVYVANHIACVLSKSLFADCKLKLIIAMLRHHPATTPLFLQCR